MRFRKQTTFNSHDTSFEKDASGRQVVNQTRGVKVRCELSINALLRFGARGASAEVIAQHLNRRLKANYSIGDIFYACKRLAKEGLIRETGKKEVIFVATQASVTKWKNLPKQ
jgi:hypothetical protein